MTHATARSTAVERLVSDIFGTGRMSHPQAVELTGWLGGSARFRDFAEAYRDKIRRKIRGARDTDAIRDVRAELCVAHLLLADRRIDLTFEAYGSGRGGPDFTVAFRGERTFNLEVTRVHGSARATAFGGPLLPKLRQLPPSTPNALVIAIEGDGAGGFDVAGAARALRSRADRKDEAFFIERGFTGTRDFYDRFLRLGAVFVWSGAAEGYPRASLWLNRSARIAVPERAANACLDQLRAS